MLVFDRLQQFHQRSHRQRRRRLLQLVALASLLAVGLLATVVLLRSTGSDSPEKEFSSDRGEAKVGVEAAMVPATGLVKARSSSDAEKLDLETVWDQVRASVVYIRSESGHGSGFVVGKDLVATNHHVVVGATKLEVCFQDGTSALASSFAARNIERDLAVIRVATWEKATPLSLAHEPPSVGAEVAAVSFFKRTGGQIAEAPNEDKTVIVTTAEVERGYSGGPLVDSQGNVVGVVCAMFPDGSKSLAIPAADLQDLIRESLGSDRPLPVPGAETEVGEIIARRDHGVYARESGWARVTVTDRSEIRRCLGHGVYLRGDHNEVEVLGGAIHENGGHGIFVWGNNNTIRIFRGEISSNRGCGVSVEGNNNVISISNCRIRNNSLSGVQVKGNYNKLEVSGGVVLGRHGADLRMSGQENQCVMTGGTFGDDGSDRDGQRQVIGYREKHLYVQALLTANDGQRDNAIRQLDEAIRLNPGYVEAYSARGYVLLQKDDYSKALSDLDEAIRLNPQMAIAYSYRGCVYRESGDLSHAIEDFTKAIQLNSQSGLSIESHRLRSACFRKMGRNVSAMDDAVEAMRLNIEVLEPYNWRNDYYAQLLKVLTDGIKPGDEVAKKFYLRGRVHFQMGDFAKTVDDCTRAINPGEESPFVYVLRALAYEKLNNRTGADADYARAREVMKGAMDQYELTRPSLD
jgi:S1-C subfamily serine protease/Flp pilus assembly protein TadD